MKQILLMLAVVALVGCITLVAYDPNNRNHVELEKAICRELGLPRGEIPRADLQRVTKLHLSSKKLTDIGALVDLPNLESLYLFNNKLTDVSALAGLTKLELLFLHVNQLTDLSPLAGLKQLKQITLSDNPNLTKAEIAKLQKALPTCRIIHTAKDPPTPPIVIAQKAKAAIERRIRNAANKSIGELTKADFEKVTSLAIVFNRLTDVDPLAKLTNLKSLQLYNNNLTNVSPLAKLTKLESLLLNNNKLTDVSPLANLTQLTLLDLQDNPDLTKAQIAELQKALPKCKIYSNPTK